MPVGGEGWVGRVGEDGKGGQVMLAPLSYRVPLMASDIGVGAVR